MAVTCANCGEELLGAVNRCWRCGQHVVSAPGSGEAPPVRQPPLNITEAQPLTATIVAETSNSSAAEIGQAELAPPTVVPPSPSLTTSPTPADGEIPPRPAIYTQRGLVDVAAVTSVVLGAVALFVGVFFSAAVVLGGLGIASALLGYRSRWRQIAVIGVLLSLMGIASGSVRLAFDAYTWWSGRSLLGPAVPTSIESTLPDSLE